MPSEAFRQILSARTDHAGDPDNFAFVESEGYIGKDAAFAEAPSFHHGNRRRGRLPGLPVIFMMELPSHHVLVQRRDCGFVGGGLEDDFAVAHDINSVRDRQNLLEAM
jgi:hypothetical protein